MLGTMMNKSNATEHRATPRYRLQNPIRLEGSTLPMAMKPAGASRRVEGHVQNISSGGLCLSAQKRLKVSEMLVGEISIPGTRASIPTLLQVRWLEKGPVGTRYRAGLLFVLQAGMAKSLQTSAQVAGSATEGKRVSRKSGSKNR